MVGDVITFLAFVVLVPADSVLLRNIRRTDDIRRIYLTEFKSVQDVGNIVSDVPDRYEIRSAGVDVIEDPFDQVDFLVEYLEVQIKLRCIVVYRQRLLVELGPELRFNFVVPQIECFLHSVRFVELLKDADERLAVSIDEGDKDDLVGTVHIRFNIEGTDIVLHRFPESIHLLESVFHTNAEVDVCTIHERTGELLSQVDPVEPSVSFSRRCVKCIPQTFSSVEIPCRVFVKLSFLRPFSFLCVDTVSRIGYPDVDDGILDDLHLHLTSLNVFEEPNISVPPCFTIADVLTVYETQVGLRLDYFRFVISHLVSLMYGR